MWSYLLVIPTARAGQRDAVDTSAFVNKASLANQPTVLGMYAANQLGERVITHVVEDDSTTRLRNT